MKRVRWLTLVALVTTLAAGAPDYGSSDAWLIDGAGPADARADVFFIHPTTAYRPGGGNAPYDAGALFDQSVVRNQISVFDGCCRVFAPRYRQATLKAQGDEDAAALDVAYGDVARAFDRYMRYDNHGRPFFIASHSQGSTHAVRLLQEEILGRPAEKLLIAAFIIGGDAPVAFSRRGLPACNRAEATRCIVSWRTLRQGAKTTGLGSSPLVWWNGAYVAGSTLAPMCVNPLNWRADGVAAPAAANIGALPKTTTDVRPAVVSGLSGAVCRDGALYVQLPSPVPDGFRDPIGDTSGNEHLMDYNLFWSNLRANAATRIAAFEAQHR